MRFTSICVLAVLILGAYFAITFGKCLLFTVHWFYYGLVPLMLLTMVVTKDRQLISANPAVAALNIRQFSKTQYFFSLIAMQLLFYAVMLWLLLGHIGQTRANFYLYKLTVKDLALIFEHSKWLYTWLPFIAVGVAGIGLMYFIVLKNKAPFLTECYFHKPKQMPWLFVHNVMTLAETYGTVVIFYIILIFVILYSNQALNVMLLDFSPLGDPLMYLLMVLPIFAISKQLNNDILKWLRKQKYSLGLVCVIFAVVIGFGMILFQSFFAKLINMLYQKNLLSYSAITVPADPDILLKFETVISGWLFINMPRLINFVARLSYGFMIRTALLLNLLATTLNAIILQFIVLPNLNKIAVWMQDPLFLFMAAIFVLVTLWLYTSYIRNNYSIWAGALEAFPTIRMRQRALSGFEYNLLLIVVILLGAGAFLGWKLSYIFINFFSCFFLPVIYAFAITLAYQLMQASFLIYRFNPDHKPNLITNH